ncbi:hypothetical protein ABKN59_004982 [Abortiporus biennis]
MHSAFLAFHVISRRWILFLLMRMVIYRLRNHSPSMKPLGNPHVLSSLNDRSWLLLLSPARDRSGWCFSAMKYRFSMVPYVPEESSSKRLNVTFKSCLGLLGLNIHWIDCSEDPRTRTSPRIITVQTSTLSMLSIVGCSQRRGHVLLPFDLTNTIPISRLLIGGLYWHRYDYYIQGFALTKRDKTTSKLYCTVICVRYAFLPRNSLLSFLLTLCHAGSCHNNTGHICTIHVGK